MNLFTRPRRFGKTLNMSMLQYFFENGQDIDGNSTDYTMLFQNLKIMECGETYLRHMSQYPVITLSLKSAKQEDFEQSFAALTDDIASEFVRHAFILKADCLTPYMKKRYKAIIEHEAERTEYNKALKFLSECLHRYYGRKVIVLIDEYDVSLESAHLYQYYPKMISFMRSLFESVLKTDPHLEFAVITGCLRISKESIFTGLNNLKIISILDERLDEGTGQRYLSLAIPNEEIRYIFRNKVSGWFNEQIRERDWTRLFHAFVCLDAKAVEEEIEDMLRKTISFNDAYESFYHGFLAGILYGMEDYIVKSNREGGRGRTDLF